jgi:hypothetical protein
LTLGIGRGEATSLIRLVAENPSLDLRKILQDARTIAVVGASEEI